MLTALNMNSMIMLLARKTTNQTISQRWAANSLHKAEDEKVYAECGEDKKLFKKWGARWAHVEKEFTK